MVGDRGPVTEGHHSLTTCLTNLPTISKTHHNSPSFLQTFSLRPRLWSPVPNQVPNQLGLQKIRSKRKCLLDAVFVGHEGQGVF